MTYQNEVLSDSHRNLIQAKKWEKKTRKQSEKKNYIDRENGVRNKQTNKQTNENKNKTFVNHISFQIVGNVEISFSNFFFF